jgi:hypothetical protein
MRRLGIVLGTLIVAGLATVPAFAQDSPSSQVVGTVQRGNTTIVFERSNADLNLDQLNAFSQIVSSDPGMVSKLAKNPSLVNDQSFVSKHPALQQYLDKYPNAREDIVANPGNYLTPTNGSSWSRAPQGMKD